jgi:hypothetical protein
VCCGCDRVVPARDLPDGAPGGDDDASDAAMAVGCPDSGPPVFTMSPGTISADNCLDYTTDLALRDTIAVCGGELRESMGDDAPVTPIVTQGGAETNLLSAPRLFPEGDRMFVSANTPTGQEIEGFERSNGVWVFAQDLAKGFPVTTSTSDDLEVTSPTRDSPRIAMVEININLVGNHFVEYALDGTGTWTEVPNSTYVASDFGLMSAKHPRITEDNQRLVFVGADGTNPRSVYIARRDGSGRWANAQPIATPFTLMTHPLLTTKCERLYLVNLVELHFIAQ